MKITEKVRDILQGKLPLLTLILFIVQPLMDVLSYWILEWEMPNTLTLLLRLFVLAATVLIAFTVSHNKKFYYIAAAVCGGLGALHMLACFDFGYQSIVTDMSNYIRVLQLPLTVFCLVTFFREDEKCFKAMKQGFVINVIIILAVQVLAIVTNTEPHTYTDGAGYIGWFSNTNTQSSILTIAAPVAVVWLYVKKGFKSPLLWLTLLGSALSMFFLGTRLAFAGIIATCIGLGLSLLFIERKQMKRFWKSPYFGVTVLGFVLIGRVVAPRLIGKLYHLSASITETYACITILCIAFGLTLLFKKAKKWEQALCFVLAGLMFILALPLAPMMGHRQSHTDDMDQKNEWIQNQIQNPKPDNPDDEMLGDPILPGKPLNLTAAQKELVETLTPVYAHYISDFVAIFGAERTIHMFNYTEDIYVLSATREKKLMFAEALMEDSPVTARLFGVELTRFTVLNKTYDVENDFHGIYYLYGIVGLLAMIAFIAYFLVIALIALIQNFKKFFTLETAALAIAFIMGVAHSYFTAGVLRRPSASFYLAAVLAAIYYIVKMKKDGAEAK